MATVKTFLFVVAATMPMAPTAELAGAEVQKVSADEAARWIQHLVPLPKQIEITGKVSLPGHAIAIVADESAGALARQAVKELREIAGPSTDPATDHPASFTIRFRRNGEGAASLAGLQNSDQAYRIRPNKDNTELIIDGREPAGLYYGAKTLQQLMKAKTESSQATIPLLKVIDWPDMADRGLWGADAYHHVRWLSDRKMNYMEQIAHSRVAPDKRTSVALSGDKALMVTEGSVYGIQAVPAILHLEQQHGRGLFDVYPDLKGQGGDEGAICYSNPVFVDILAEWILGYARMPGVAEVDVWMTENLHGKGGCSCPKCAKQNRDIQELRVILSAWRKACQTRPGIKLRVLTSEETKDSNEQMLAELPPEVGLWYYHSLLTYNTREASMIPGYLAAFAAQHQHVGVCCNLSAEVSLAQPFTGAAFIHYRLNEFVDKNISGLMGYSTPRVSYVAFNVEAAAEWSWNAKGRSPREFAFSWAVREGLEDPETFAEWSETLGPVAWDVYGSAWPAGEQRKALKNVARQLREGKLPELGVVLWGVYPSPWGDIKTIEQLNDNVTRARKAVQLAHTLNHAAILQESLTIEGYMNALKALWELKSIITTDGIKQEQREAAQHYFKMYADGMDQAKTAISEWENLMTHGNKKWTYTNKTVSLIQEMITEMNAFAKELGVDPAMAH